MQDNAFCIFKKLPRVSLGRFNLLTLVTALEYFDFTSFSLFYRFIPFAGNYPGLQFVVGYTGRFIGSIAVSIFHKHYGNKVILLSSVWCMTICTFLIGILPNHFLSKYLLYLLRILQGLSFAIEFPAGSFLAAQKKEYGSTVQGATIGYIFALLFFKLITGFFPTQSIGWRFPFLIGGLFGLYLAIQRTKDFERALTLDQPLLAFISYISVLWILFRLFNYLRFNLKICGILILVLLLLLISNHLAKKLPQKWISKLLVNDSSLAVSTIFLYPIYFLSLLMAMAHSISQAKLVSNHPTLTNVSLISLLVPLLFSHVHPVIFHLISVLLLTFLSVQRSVLIGSVDLKVLLLTNFFTIILLQVIPFTGLIQTVLYLDCSRYRPILLSDSKLDFNQFILGQFILNQTIITSFILTSIKYSGIIFKSRPYLAPIAHNGITLLASLIVNQLTG